MQSHLVSFRIPDEVIESAIASGQLAPNFSTSELAKLIKNAALTQLRSPVPVVVDAADINAKLGQILDILQNTGGAIAPSECDFVSESKESKKENYKQLNLLEDVKAIRSNYKQLNLLEDATAIRSNLNSNC